MSTARPSRPTSDTLGIRELDCEMLLFLLCKPVPKLRKPHQCRHLDHDGARCSAPVWGDGKVTCRVAGKLDNHWFGLCAGHWHLWNAFHGAYSTTAANPAAGRLMVGGKLDQGAIDRLTFNALPDVGAERPDTFPSEWL